MPRQDQRQPALPFDVFDSVEARIRSYVSMAAPTLHGMHVSQAVLIEVLSRPHQFWRRVVKQKGSKTRICFAPSPELRTLHIAIARYLRNRLEKISKYNGLFPSVAFRRGDSIVRNARYHYGNQSSLVLDLRDAFGSIRTKHVFHCFKRMMSRELAWLFSRSVTYHGRLAQGSLVSPLVFNILMHRFDKAVIEATGASEIPHFVGVLSNCGLFEGRCMEYLRQHRPLVYTRYGDDLSFSSPELEFPLGIEPRVREIVTQFGLKLNRRRKEGRQGILELPGVRVVKGRIQPDNKVLQRYALALSSGAPEQVVKGYRSFLNQFPRSGRRNAQRIAEGIASHTP
jgi:hypothetical protein